MKAHAITIVDNEISEKGYDKLSKSFFNVKNEMGLSMFEAITPKNVDKVMLKHNIKWNYPWEGSVVDFATGLKKSAYVTKNQKARMACAMSHYLLWRQCYETNEALIILEHDALFLTRIDFRDEETGFNIVGLNNPKGCTRKSQLYYDRINESPQPFQLAPYIDDDYKVPQGLAGNSAYMIKPKGAEQMLTLVQNYGLWPNDAIMCRQLVKGLGVSKKFYTTVQRLQSTTTT